MRKSIITLGLLAMFLFLMISCSKNPTAQSEPTLAEKLQEALENGVQAYEGKGVSASVIMPDGETWTGVSGISHGTTAITEDMAFAAGSITKNFTATVILQLAEEGAIALDDSLFEWLPAFPYIDSTITIRQLLNHTSGIFDMIDNPDIWQAVFQNPSRVWTPGEMVTAFQKEALFPKGTDWNYSSSGYALLRAIIENITGTDIKTVYSDRIFVPFGLGHSFASTGEPLPANTAHGWWDLDSDGNYDDFFTWPRTAFASGVGGEIFSTAEDLAKWAKALFHDEIVLNEATLNQMLTFHSPCTGEEFFADGYGLGAAQFNQDFFNDLYAIGHSGNAPGYAAACIYLPDYGVCLGFMDNTEHGDAMMTLLDVLDVIIEHIDES